MSTNLRLVLMLTLLNMLWVPVNLAVTAAQHTMSTGAILLTRWGLFCLLGWALLSFKAIREFLKVKFPEGPGRFHAVLIGLFLFGPAHALYYTGLQSTSTGEGMVLNTSSPLWIGLLAFLILRENVNWVRWLAILIGAAGSYVVAMGFSAPSLDSGHALGNLLYLSGVIMESLAMILAIRIIRTSSGSGTLAYELIGCALAACVMPLVVPTKLGLWWHTPDQWTVLSMAYLVLVAGLFCFGTWYRSVEKAPISLMVISLGMQAPLGVLLGHFVKGEALTSTVGVGSALILGALLLAANDSRTPVQPEVMQA